MNKPDSGKVAHSGLKPETQVTVGGRNPHAHHGYINTPVYHASTLLYRTAKDFPGRRGTPTLEALPLYGMGASWGGFAALAAAL